MYIEDHGIEYESEEELLARDSRSGTVASPYCVLSCLAAVLAAGLFGSSAYMAILSAGETPILYVLAGFFAVPVTILGLWLGLTGKNEREEKRQKTGTVGCVANALLFFLLIGIYVVGLIY